jgi:hypothetical protein
VFLRVHLPHDDRVVEDNRRTALRQ